MLETRNQYYEVLTASCLWHPLLIDLKAKPSDQYYWCAKVPLAIFVHFLLHKSDGTKPDLPSM